MRLYDSMTQAKREFVPRDKDRVTMYFCGPTVYNYVHVGNARPYVVSMVAKRYFESQGYKVTLVENITDIDDKIIRRANEERRSTEEVALEFAEAYREDTGKLGLGRPDIEPLATEHIGEIIELVSKLVEKGHAYVAGGDVYFDVDSFPEYGKLSKQKISEMRAGARVEPGEAKADPLDFALWKAAKPGEPWWESPWGKGRPGWHIECSAMSLKYLGPGFDIHGGGRDLIFPHHENEIAQAEAALGRPFVRFWMHNGMLTLRDEKMSKSLGNILTLREVLEAHPPEALILVFLGSHYRSPLEFGEEVMQEAEQQAARIRNTLRQLREHLEAGRPTLRDHSLTKEAALEQAGEKYGSSFANLLLKRRRAFDEALADDLNTAAALAELFSAVREINAELGGQGLSYTALEAAQTTLENMLHVLCLDLLKEEQVAIPPEVEALARERQACRARKDFARADAIRAQIAEMGFEVRDVPGGYKIVPKG